MEALAITNGVAILLFLSSQIVDGRVRARRRRYEDQVRTSDARAASYIDLLAAAPAALAGRGGWALIERRGWTPGWVMAIVESRQAAALSQFSAAYAVVLAHGSDEGRRIAGDLFEAVMDAKFHSGEPERESVGQFRNAMSELRDQVRRETISSHEARSQS